MHKLLGVGCYIGSMPGSQATYIRVRCKKEIPAQKSLVFLFKLFSVVYRSTAGCLFVRASTSDETRLLERTSLDGGMLSCSWSSSSIKVDCGTFQIFSLSFQPAPSLTSTTSGSNFLNK